MREKYINKLKNKNGAYTLLAVIFLFLICLTITAYSDMLKKNYTLNEVQSIMDMSGVSSLEALVKDNKAELKEEILAVSKDDYIDTDTSSSSKGKKLKNYDTIVFNKYKSLISDSIKTNDNIISIQVQSQDISFSNIKYGLGETTKARPQITLDTTARVVINVSPNFDTIEKVTKKYWSARKNTEFQIISTNATEDGKTELIIRSVSRLVYR